MLNVMLCNGCIHREPGLIVPDWRKTVQHPCTDCRIDTAGRPSNYRPVSYTITTQTPCTESNETHTTGDTVK